MPLSHKFTRMFSGLVAFAGILNVSVLCPAQDVQPPLADQAVVPMELVVEEPQEAVIDDGKVSLDFKDADIKNILKILSIRSGLNIIATPDVQGVVTVQLTDVPWREALSVILSTYSYAYEQKGNIIIVSTIEDLKKRREDAVSLAEQENLITRTLPLNFAQADAIIESLKKLNSSRGTIDFDQRTNMLIVTDIETKIDQIADAVSQLDETTPQILIEGKIIETSFTDTENLGVDWTTTAKITGPVRPHNWPFGTKDGSNFTTTNFPSAGGLGTTVDTFTYGTLSLAGVTAIFNALKTRSNTNIISNPRIVTQNNQTAKIMVGTQYPIPSYNFNEETGQLKVSGFEYKDIGIIFEVTPHANSAGYITMDIKPQVTAKGDDVTFEGATIPQIINRSAETKVMIKDGETLVIAGLIQSDKTNTRQHVPILGSIPVVNLLFRNKDIEDTKTDLLIFLTPHIITPSMNEPVVK